MAGSNWAKQGYMQLIEPRIDNYLIFVGVQIEEYQVHYFLFLAQWFQKLYVT